MRRCVRNWFVLGGRLPAADSLRQVRDIMAQTAMKKYKPQEWKPGVQFQTDEELAKLAADIANTIFHPVGTAELGLDDDPYAGFVTRLRLRGVKGLRVVDASIMPDIVSGNTNSPTLMIAEKAARWIQGQLWPGFERFAETDSSLNVSCRRY